MEKFSSCCWPTFMSHFLYNDQGGTLRLPVCSATSSSVQLATGDRG